MHDLRSLRFIDLTERGFTDTIDQEFFVTLSVDPVDVLTRNELVALSVRDLLSLDEGALPGVPGS